ncbi:MAG: 4-hydroxy-tetrahydrodipicolinate reductase [Vulcanimicrobiaceae bacterium]
MIKVAVAGALGRMGRLACEAIRNAPDLEYAGGFARTALPADWIYDDLLRLFHERKPDVIVDFTTHPKTLEIAEIAVTHGVSPIIGSSAWTDEERAELRAQVDERGIGAMLVPNFAIGAVLMMRFAEQAARYFPTAEIVEMHRVEKLDKPSGTSRETAERVRAGGGPQDVPIHSVRLKGALAHQEVLFGNTGEILTIRHDSLSYQSFAPGILYAVRRARNLHGFVIGLEAVLDTEVTA